MYTFIQEWIFGKALCHLVLYAQGTSVYISTLTLTSIAIDRFRLIISPFKPRMKQQTCVYIITGIWAFSLLATLPYGIFLSHELIYDHERIGGTKWICQEVTLINLSWSYDSKFRSLGRGFRPTIREWSDIRNMPCLIRPYTYSHGLESL